MKVMVRTEGFDYIFIRDSISSIILYYTCHEPAIYDFHHECFAKVCVEFGDDDVRAHASGRKVYVHFVDDESQYISAF